MTRPVMVFEWFRPEDAAYNAPYEKVEMGPGIFHQFGVNYEEFESGAASYSTAIVEMPDGTIVNAAVEMIRFEDDGG